MLKLDQKVSVETWDGHLFQVNLRDFLKGLGKKGWLDQTIAEEIGLQHGVSYQSVEHWQFKPKVIPQQKRICGFQTMLYRMHTGWRFATLVESLYVIRDHHGIALAPDALIHALYRDKRLMASISTHKAFMETKLQLLRGFRRGAPMKCYLRYPRTTSEKRAFYAASDLDKTLIRGRRSASMLPSCWGDAYRSTEHSWKRQTRVDRQYLRHAA
ncbi:MAG: hypothetical protein IBX50_08265 [Marinospirillum sp.]|uniref:hypothetical protein n=1 Tax=Marinospirillum sp. TaxID=2183934 RepID=UPI0019EB889F|nr:hypothetical protein [Marinospirillum sp.]MBE0506700.1 hypothetical protein [Marinospirillum sp.]